MTIDPRLKRIVAAQPYPLLFATIIAFHESEYQRLRSELQAAHDASRCRSRQAKRPASR